MKHEPQQTRICDPHQCSRVHTDSVTILRQQLSRDRLENCESSAQHQRNPRKRNQEPAVAKGHIEQAGSSLIGCWSINTRSSDILGSALSRPLCRIATLNNSLAHVRFNGLISSILPDDLALDGHLARPPGKLVLHGG